MAYGLEVFRANGTLLMSSENRYLKVVTRITLPITRVKVNMLALAGKGKPYWNYVTTTLSVPEIDIPGEFIVDVKKPFNMNVRGVQTTVGTGYINLTYDNWVDISVNDAVIVFYITVWRKR